MRRKKLFGIVALVIFFISNTWFVGAQETYYQIEEVKSLKTNDSKDIQRIGSCWGNAGSALLEAELIRTGKSGIDLAEMDFIHNSYLEKAKVYLESDGAIKLSEKGMAQDVMLCMDEYGMVPESAYMKSGKDALDPKQGEMDGILKGVLANVVQVEKGVFTERWQSIYDAGLSGYIGEARIEFKYEDEDFTPKSFAEKSGLKSSDYVLLTADNREEPNEPFVLKKRENWHSDKFYNVKMDNFVTIIANEIDKGYAVLWYGVLDKELIFEDERVAIVPAGAMPGDKKQAEGEQAEKMPVAERIIAEGERQIAYETNVGQEQDYLLIYGISKDKKGNQYFIAKQVCQANSTPINLSMEYVKLNTLFLMTNKNGIPKEIKAGLGF